MRITHWVRSQPQYGDVDTIKNIETKIYNLITYMFSTLKLILITIAMKKIARKDIDSVSESTS